MRKLICYFGLILFSIRLFADDTSLPNIAYCYPAGGQQGTTVKVLLGGRNFKNLKDVFISGEGVSVKVVNLVVPATKGDAGTARRRFEKLAAQKYAKSETVEAVRAAYRQAEKDPEFKKILDNCAFLRMMWRVREFSSDALADTVELEIKIDPNAKLSKRYIRITTPNGCSAPIAFFVDNLPEVVTPSMRERVLKIVDEGKGWRLKEMDYEDNSAVFLPAETKPTRVTLPVIVNGQINLTEADRFEFDAKKGQKIVFAVQARSLIPYIGDAVPGWFQSSIAIYNSKGDEIAYADDFYQYPDPLIAVDIPEDGTYSVEIKDAVYRGREDFVYRMLIGEVPFVTGIYPLGGKKNAETKVSIYGWNFKPLEVGVRKTSSGVSPLNMRNEGIFHNTVSFQTLDLDAYYESEDNNTIHTPNPAPLHSAIDAKIGTKGDIDFYKVELSGGKKILAEVYARRLNSPIDAYLKIYDEDGNIIAHNDDNEDITDGMTTHHADPRLEFTPPKDGTYFFSVEDSQGKFGDEYSYRLCIGYPAAVFEIKANPSVINLTEGKSTTFNVHVMRKNSIEYPISINIKNLPEGVSYAGGEIPANANSALMTLSAAKDLKAGFYNIEIEGSAKILNSKVINQAQVCEDMLQAFYINHLVPINDEQKIYIRAESDVSKKKANATFAIPLQRIANKTLSIPLGGKARFDIGALQTDKDTKLEFELISAPEGITIVEMGMDKNGYFVVIAADKEKVKKGQKGSLALDIFGAVKKKDSEIINRHHFDISPAFFYEIR